MTIGFLINTSEPFYRGGYERRAWTFARELVRQGHDVRIYTSCPRDEVIDGVRFVRLGGRHAFFNARGVRNGWADLLFALGCLRLLWKVRGRLDVLDVCATPFIHLPFVAFACKLRRIPVVMTCHEALLESLPAYVQERGTRGPVMDAIRLRVLAKIYKFGMGLFPRRLAVSKRTSAALQREGFPAKGVVEFGLEPEVFQPEAPMARDASEPARFVFCGRLNPIKNVEKSVTALLSLRWEGESFHFDVIGDGSERLTLERMVHAAGSRPWITFHGEVSEEYKRNLFAKSDIFVLSSPREGFSIATLEAMAQGCGALIVSNPDQPSGALDFVQPDEQGLCVTGGGEPMRRALQTLIRDPARRLALRQSAWTKAKAYRIEEQTRRLVEFYQSLRPVRA